MSVIVQFFREDLDKVENVAEEHQVRLVDKKVLIKNKLGREGSDLVSGVIRSQPNLDEEELVEDLRFLPGVIANKYS